MSVSKKLRLSVEDAAVTKMDTTPMEYPHKTSAEVESAHPTSSDPVAATKKSAVINFDTELVGKLQGKPFIPPSNGKLERLWWRPIALTPSSKSGYSEIIVSCFLLGGVIPAKTVFDPYSSDDTLYGYPATFKVSSEDLYAMGYSLHCLNYGCTGPEHMIFATDIDTWKSYLKQRFMSKPELAAKPEQFPSWAFKHELDHLTEELGDKQMVLMRKVLDSKEYSSTWGVKHSRSSFSVEVPAKKIKYYFSSFILTKKLSCVRIYGGDYAFAPSTTPKVVLDADDDDDDDIVEVAHDLVNRKYFHKTESTDVL